MPPDQRNNYDCEKESTGPLNRKKLIEHINKEALETPDKPEFEPFIKGKVRGKKWVAPPPDAKQTEIDEKIAIDLGDEYEQALTDASQEEIIDLAGVCSSIFLRLIHTHTHTYTQNDVNCCSFPFAFSNNLLATFQSICANNSSNYTSRSSISQKIFCFCLGTGRLQAINSS